MSPPPRVVPNSALGCPTRAPSCMETPGPLCIAPTLASVVLPALHEESPGTTPVHTYFSSSHPTREAHPWSAPRLQAMPDMAPTSQSHKTHTQSTQGTTTDKTIPSNLGKVAVPLNSYKHTHKSKQSWEIEEYALNGRTRQSLRGTMK